MTRDFLGGDAEKTTIEKWWVEWVFKKKSRKRKGKVIESCLNVDQDREDSKEKSVPNNLHQHKKLFELLDPEHR